MFRNLTIHGNFFANQMTRLMAILFLILVFPPWLDAAMAQGVPEVKPSLKPLDLSRPLSNQELMAAGQLGGQLYPTHVIANEARERAINQSFGEAIQAWNQHEYRAAVEMFQRHVSQYPDSPWAAEAILHIGCEALYHGRYHEADRCFRQILGQHGADSHPGAQLMVIKARLRLANLESLQGNIPEAMKHLRIVKQASPDWRDRTYASHWIQRLSRERHQELAMLNCGVQALAHILNKEGKVSQAKKVLSLTPASRSGHSMKDLKSLAAGLGYELCGLRLSVDQLSGIPLPAIVQLNGIQKGDRGHYWVLETSTADVLTFFDPQSNRRFTQSQKEFSREWDGNALVFSRGQKLPGNKLAAREMGGVYGGCCGAKRPESNLGSPGNSNPCGSTAWAVNKVNFNFYANDVPLWYRPPIGPLVAIALSYNSQSAIAEHEPFGNKWQFNYAPYLVEDTSGQVTVFMPDGRRDIFTPDGTGGYTPSFQVFNRLDKLGSNHFELHTPEDTVYVYDIPAGTASQQPFLVQIREAHNLALTFGYDANINLTTITDAVGSVTTLSYNTNRTVSQVTDPFGRHATFNYDASGNLIQITDMGGYTTNISYNADVYITGIDNGRGPGNFIPNPPMAFPMVTMIIRLLAAPCGKITA